MTDAALNIPTNPRRLGGVTYRVAGKRDYVRLHKFLASENSTHNTLGFPTVFAERDGDIIGLLATTIKNDMIMVGPLVLKSGARRPFTALRLAEAHESILLNLGVTSYIFSAENEMMKKYAASLGLIPYAERDGRSFYIRHLGKLPNG